MAFVNEDDENDPNAPVQTSTPGGIITGSGGNSNTKAPSAPNSPGGMPGNFVGINQYIEANKPQSEKLANQVGSYITDLGDTARATQQDQKNQFQNAVDTNTVGFDQNLYNEAQNNPQAVAADAAKKASFQKMYNASYNGPQTFTGSDYDAAATNATKAATDAAAQTENEEGQKQLVSNLQNKTAGYTNQGASAFDSALLQAAPNARTTLSDARSKESDLSANLDAIRAEENKAATNANIQTNTTGQTFQNTFGNQNLQKQIENTLNKRAADETTASSQKTSALIQKLQNGQPLTNEETHFLGMDTTGNISPINSINTYKNYVGDLSPYFSTQTPNITGQQVATPEEYARYAALNDLTGDQGNYLTNPALSGTGNRSAVNSFDLSKFMNDALAKRNLSNPTSTNANATLNNPTGTLQNRLDSAVNGAAVLGPAGVPIGMLSPEIQKAGSSISNAGKRLGGAVSNAFKGISDRNLKKDISKFNPSEFLDSLTRKKYG